MAIANIEFKSRVFVSGAITALTGLHIGGNSTDMSIGGADKIVIRDPVTSHPYIPGSSLRGKLRSLYEKTYGEMTIKFDGAPTVLNVKDMDEPLSKGAKIKSAGPSTDLSARASKLFGVPVDQQKGDRPENIVPQRLVVRDSRLINADFLEKAKHTDMPLTEVKTEVNIDRITSAANPRQIERVPAGAEFEFEFILNLYGDDGEQEYINQLFECMALLQDDYLGGHGSRGYGRLRFDVKTVAKKTIEDYRENRPAQILENLTVPAALKKP